MQESARILQNVHLRVKAMFCCRRRPSRCISSGTADATVRPTVFPVPPGAFLRPRQEQSADGKAGARKKSGGAESQKHSNSLDNRRKPRKESPERGESSGGSDERAARAAGGSGSKATRGASGAGGAWGAVSSKKKRKHAVASDEETDIELEGQEKEGASPRKGSEGDEVHGRGDDWHGGGGGDGGGSSCNSSSSGGGRSSSSSSSTFDAVKGAKRKKRKSGDDNGNSSAPGGGDGSSKGGAGKRKKDRSRHGGAAGGGSGSGDADLHGAGAKAKRPKVKGGITNSEANEGSNDENAANMKSRGGEEYDLGWSTAGDGDGSRARDCEAARGRGSKGKNKRARREKQQQQQNQQQQQQQQQQTKSLSSPGSGGGSTEAPAEEANTSAPSHPLHQQRVRSPDTILPSAPGSPEQGPAVVAEGGGGGDVEGEGEGGDDAGPGCVPPTPHSAAASPSPDARRGQSLLPRPAQQLAAAQYKHPKRLTMSEEDDTTEEEEETAVRSVEEGLAPYRESTAFAATAAGAAPSHSTADDGVVGSARANVVPTQHPSSSAAATDPKTLAVAHVLVSRLRM